MKLDAPACFKAFGIHSHVATALKVPNVVLDTRGFKAFGIHSHVATPE
jgi:hypothetical protein